MDKIELRFKSTPLFDVFKLHAKGVDLEELQKEPLREGKIKSKYDMTHYYELDRKYRVDHQMNMVKRFMSSSGMGKSTGAISDMIDTQKLLGSNPHLNIVGDPISAYKLVNEAKPCSYMLIDEMDKYIGGKDDRYFTALMNKVNRMRGLQFFLSICSVIPPINITGYHYILKALGFEFEEVKDKKGNPKTDDNGKKMVKPAYVGFSIDCPEFHRRSIIFPDEREPFFVRFEVKDDFLDDYLKNHKVEFMKGKRNTDLPTIAALQLKDDDNFSRLVELYKYKQITKKVLVQYSIKKNLDLLLDFKTCKEVCDNAMAMIEHPDVVKAFTS